MAAVDVVVVSYNTRDLLSACLSAIRETVDASEVHVVVVDNASDDGSPQMVREAFSWVDCIALDSNRGFGSGNNLGARSGNAPYILFLNSDAVVQPGAIATLAAFMDKHADAAATGPRLRYPDKSFHPSCRRFPTPLRIFWQRAGLADRWPDRFRSLQDWLSESEHVHGRRVDMISGACMMVRRDYFERLGGFDENLFLYEEEMDLFYPASRLESAVYFCGNAEVVHHHGGSSSERGPRENAFVLFHQARSRYYCFRKHYGPAWAWLGYLLESGVLGASALYNRIRGRESEASLCREQCTKGFQEAMKLPLIGAGRI